MPHIIGSSIDVILPGSLCTAIQSHGQGKGERRNKKRGRGQGGREERGIVAEEAERRKETYRYIATQFIFSTL